MNEPSRIEEATASAQVNGKAAIHSRVADLLDDVTVGGEPRVAASSAPPETETPAAAINDIPAPVTEPRLAPPAAPIKPPASPPMPDTPSNDDHTEAAASPETHPATQPESGTAATLPGEPFVGGMRRVPPVAPLPAATEIPSEPPITPAPAGEPESPPAADVPPFLAKPAAPRMPVPKAEMPPAAAAPVPPATGETELPVDGAQAAPNQLINIKGRSEGIAVEIGKGSWNEIMAALAERLDASGRFFRKGSVALDTGPRPVSEDELHQLAGVLATHEMTLGIVRTASERTFQAALALGFTATLESAEGAPMAAAAPADTNTDAASYFVYRGYLRSGHRLRRKENILVIGDINPGAEVVSDGDILVWGRLRGIVQAGAGGNKRAIVAALDLEPTQLRIADVATMGPDPKPGQPGRFFWRRSQHKRPEIARIVDEAVVLEEWDAARPGGLVSLRRGAG